MEVVSNNFMPGDPRLIDHIVYELKSQGIFDNFRKECIADVDTKPAYQNLRQRVEGSVSGFLKTQRWRPDMNKNQVREMLRKNISESGFLETGVERIVDQVVNPKINSIFLPQVENVVYKVLGIHNPSAFDDLKRESKSATNNEQCDLGNNLLPSDLETVSPESEHDKKLDTSNESQKLDDRMDEDESPPFEPLEETTSFIAHEENSVDSHLSGFSGLASHDSNHSIGMSNKVTPMEISNQDSQLSKQSSDDHLSIVMSDDTETKIEMNDDSTHSKISNSKVTDSNSKSFDFMQDRSGSEKSVFAIKEDQNDVAKKVDDLKKVEDNKADEAKKIEEPKKIEDCKKTEDSKRSEDKPKSDERKSDKHRSSSHKHKSRNDSRSESKDHKSDKDRKSDKKEHRDKSSHNSKDRKEKDKERKDSKSKSGKDEKDGDTKSDKDRDRSKSSSSKHNSSNRDKSSSKKESSDSKTKESSESKDAKAKEPSDVKDVKVKESSDNKDAKLKVKGDKDSSKSKSESKAHSSSKSYSKHNGKSKSDVSDSSKNSSKTSKKDEKSHRKDDKHHSRSEKHSSSSSKKDEKQDRDKKSSKKDSKREVKDDHYGLKGKKSNRRSTDRDSSDGHSGTHSSSSSFADLSMSSQAQKSSQDSSVVNSGSSSGDSGNSDHVGSSSSTHATVATADESQPKVSEVLNREAASIASLQQLHQLKLLKPKIASNIFEARKLMKIRKKLAKMEKRTQMELMKSAVMNNSLSSPIADINVANHVEIGSPVNEPQNSEDSNNKPNILKKQRNVLKNNASKSYARDKGKTELKRSVKTQDFKKDKPSKQAKHLQGDEDDEDIAEVVEASDDINTAPLQSAVISKESWDAIEAKLNSENLLKVDYNSYVDSSEDAHKSDEKEVLPVQSETTKKAEEDCLGFDNETYLHAQRQVDLSHTSIQSLKEDICSFSETQKLQVPHHRCQPEPDTTSQTTLVEGLNKKLPKIAIVDVTTDGEILISPSRGIKRHAEADYPDVHNNNKTANELEIDLLDERLNHIADKVSHPTKTASKAKKAKIVDSSANQLDSFNLPLSPAESDKSFTTAGDKQSDAKLKRNNNRSLRSQRYSSDDLYKPRLQFSRTRRRGNQNPDAN